MSTQAETAKHTPGPWVVEHIDAPGNIDGAMVILAVDGPGDESICRVWSRTMPYVTRPGKHHNRGNFVVDPVALANARLIAAAPDLLAACKAAVPAVEFLRKKAGSSWGDGGIAVEDFIRAAIAKAEGGVS